MADDLKTAMSDAELRQRCTADWFARKAVVDALAEKDAEIAQLRAELKKLKAMCPAWWLIDAGFADNLPPGADS